MLSLGQAYGEIVIGTDKAQQNVQSLAQTMRSVGQTMTTTLSLPILGVAAAGLNAAAGFEQSMNQIQVVGGVAADAMASLNAQALQLGAETSFSAGEAAQGMLELAKAGLDAEEVMASIGGTLDLAAAGNLSVAQAAEITANAMNAFSLPAEEATRVANLLAAAANSSSVEVTDMAQAFQMSASVFGANKVPIDQLSAAIAILGNNGLKGSDAGTSMKTMLMRLTAPTNEAAAQMQDLGLAVYNADGSMRSFQDIVADLGSATAGLTDEQRNMALTTIFGADAIRAANILIKEGAGEFENMMGAVNKAGAATEVANARMKGLAGAIQYIKGTIESLMIGAFQPFLQGIADMIRGVADMMASFGQLPQPIINAVLAFLGVLGVAGPLIFAIGQIGVVMGALLNPIGLVVLAVAALAAAWAADFMGIRGLTLEAWGAIQPMLQALWSWLGVQIPAGLAVLQSWWAAVWPALSGAVTAAWALIEPVLENLRTLVMDAMQSMSQGFAGLGPQLTRLGEAFGQLFAAVAPILQGLAMLIAGVFGIVSVVAINGFLAVMENLPTAIGTVIDTLAAVISGLATVVSSMVAGVTALMQGDFAGAWAAAQGIVSGVLAGLMGIIGGFVGMVGIAWSVLKSTIVGTLETLGFTELAAQIDGIAAKVEGGWLQIKDSVTLAVQTFSWADFVEVFTWANVVTTALNWADYIAALDWAGYIATALDWASFVGQLTWDSVFVPALDWAAYVTPLAWDVLVTALSDWGAYITSLDWTTIITTAIDWATWIPALSWTALITAVEWSAYIVGFAWSAFVSVLDWATATGTGIDWATFIGAFSWENAVKAINWVDYIVGFTWDSFITKLEWTGTVAKLENWATYIPTLSWSDVVTALSDWGSYITALDWTTIITTAIDWATWIPALSWNGFVTLLDWATIVGVFAWTEYISQIDWTTTVSTLSWADFVTALSDWGAYITSIDWAGYIAKLVDWTAFIGAFAWDSFVGKLEWPLIAQFNWAEWVAKLEWPVISWPGFSTFVKALVWPAILWPGFGEFVARLAWPRISWPGWASFVPTFSWPSIPAFPGWGSLMNVLGVGGGEEPKSKGRGLLDRIPTMETPANAGRMLPASAARAAGGGQTINLSIEVGSMSSALDIEELAWRIEKRLARAASGR